MLNIQRNVPLSKYTTLQVGGPAAYFVEVKTEKELDEAVGFATEKDLQITVLGGGSNVLVSDDGLSGMVIRVAITEGPTEEAVSSDEVLVSVGAGMEFDKLIAWATENRLWGLENLSHIPGSVGATPVQNVGAYGVEVKDVIESVRVYSITDRQFRVLTNTECSFGYRDSYFKHGEGSQLIITSVTYRLSHKPKPVLSYKDLQERFADDVVMPSDIRQAVIEIRAQKFPNWHEVGTAGSFFKNPIIDKDKFTSLQEQYPNMPHFEVNEQQVKVPLGWVLDKVLHLKGEGTERVKQYEGQALVLVNRGDATAAEIVDHAEHIVDLVSDKLGVQVEWEVTRLGF